MTDEGPRNVRSWAQAEPPLPETPTSARPWKRFCGALFVLVLIGVGAVGMTLFDSMRTTEALSKNLELKQRVREIEGTLKDVDHIMVQLRLVDAQVKTIVQENQEAENTEP